MPREPPTAYLLDDVPRRRAISGGGSIIAVILGIPGGFGTPSPAPGASKFSFESPPSGASSVGGVVLSDSAGVAAGRERAGESPLMPAKLRTPSSGRQRAGEAARITLAITLDPSSTAELARLCPTSMMSWKESSSSASLARALRRSPSRSLSLLRSRAASADTCAPPATTTMSPSITVCGSLSSPPSSPASSRSSSSASARRRRWRESASWSPPLSISASAPLASS
mmetsp:Transcript_40954/g.78218  ORF Transcript_40954/g.78218 Transcript_40954/m.78218 type:complete len:227 (-) Transcript_40954:1046-1726(-)